MNCIEKLHEILDLSDSRVNPYKFPRDRMRSGEDMLLDSEKIVIRAISSGIVMKSILATRKYFERHQEIISKLEDCEFLCAEHKLLEGIVGHRIHQGFMAVGVRPDDYPLKDLGNRIIVLNKVLDVSNVGAIVRSAHAFGVDSILVDEEGCSPYGRRSVRVSMGSIFNMKIHHSSNLVVDLRLLKTRFGYQVVEAAKRDNAVSTVKAKYSPKSLLIIGNENSGLTKEVQDLCDMTVVIPISNSIDSLNAACAASILLYSWQNNLNLPENGKINEIAR